MSKVSVCRHFPQLESCPFQKAINLLYLKDEVGGAWGLTHEVNKRLAAKGWEVHLITCKPTDGLPDYEVVEGVHFHRIRRRDSKNLFSL